MRTSLALLFLAGCASGARDTVDALINEGIDAAVAADAAIVDGRAADAAVADAQVVDAAPTPDAVVAPDAAPMIDAAVMVDAAPMIDAPVMIDAGCTPTTTELLLNPALDLTPRAVSWTEVSGQAVDLITDQAGTPAAHTAPYRAWLGGFDSNSDALFQTVTIPANTTKLELSGVYAVGTGETTTTIQYDHGDIALANTAGTIVEDVLPLSNLSVTTVAWTSFDHIFAATFSGQTLQVRMTATGDVSNATSFFFDTLSLKATHCP